jgi:cytochrome P460
MRRNIIVLALSLVGMLITFAYARSSSIARSPSGPLSQPVYTSDGKLVLPANYRDWSFLTSGFGMNYSNGGGSHPMFTNVYVAPEALQGFKATGKWPDKSMFIVEIYSPASQGSINKSGYYQDQFHGLDVEVKDSSRPNEWSYYNFDPGEKQAAAMGGGCNKCHSEHAAVEHTFVQFYPTLLGFAQEKNLIKPGVQVR